MTFATLKGLLFHVFFEKFVAVWLFDPKRCCVGNMIRLFVICTMLMGSALCAAPGLALKDVEGHLRTPLRGTGKQPAVVFFHYA